MKNLSLLDEYSNLKKKLMKDFEKYENSIFRNRPRYRNEMNFHDYPAEVQKDFKLLAAVFSIENPTEAEKVFIENTISEVRDRLDSRHSFV